MPSVPNPLADEIDRRIEASPDHRTVAIRRIRREYSQRLQPAPPGEVLDVADALVERRRWVAYELVHHHPGALAALDRETVTRLGRIPDAAVHEWARSPDRWWRRAALVSTVPLNLRAAGGTGDAERTLAVCAQLVSDRDDMVVKALSWALRALVKWDPDAVRAFVAAHGDVLAARVRREVTTMLETGRKQRPA